MDSDLDLNLGSELGGRAELAQRTGGGFCFRASLETACFMLISKKRGVPIVTHSLWPESLLKNWKGR